ncbi:hyalin-like [Asterias amurensis]|uniref:hyalin-like n=1 Tax=Asterias amurensis TaxID=7602 RepID=UPI003AB58564
MRNVDPSMAVANVTWLPLPSANDTVEGPIDFTNIVCWDHLGNIVMSGDGFPVGLTIVTCRANDTVPNEGACDFNITIIDSEAPFVYCPADIPLIYVDQGMANASVTWIPLPTANDTVDGPINATSIVCSDDLGNVVKSDDRFQVRLTMVTCRVNDSASLEGMCQFNITVEDNEPPTVSCPDHIVDLSDLGMPGALIPWIPLPTASDNLDVINRASIVCTDDSGTVVMSGNLFGVGLTTVTCQVNDTALNEGSCNFTIAISDNESPNVTCPMNVSTVVDSGSSAATILWVPTPSAVDNIDTIDPASIICVDNYGSIVMSGDQYPANLTTVTCQVNDTQQNEGSCSFTIAVSDNESPNVTCPMNVSAVVDSGSAVATILWEPTPSAVDNIDTIDPASIICVDNSGSIVMSGGQYPANLTTVTCQVNDTQQNEGSCSFTIAVSDNESPNVTCPMNVSAVVDSGSAVATILWEPTPSAVDNIDTIDPASIICVDNSGSIVTSGGQYPANLTTVTCQVNDTQQNEGSCSFTIAVSDNESPNVTCPMNVSAVVDSGSSVATILWVPTPSAVDNIDTIDPASIICVDNSGSIVTSGGQYPATLTTVTCQVNDTQQNEGSCSFTIAVSDNESPNVTCPMNVSAVVDSGSSVATILWVPTPSAVDNIDTIDPASIICVDNSGSIVTSGGQYPANLTTVTCQVNDTQQNEGSCSFTIAVSDNESPNVTCPMNVSAVVDSGSAVATILWEPTPSAVDNIDTIDPTSIICVDNSGSIVTSGGQYPANLTTVTCQVNDTQQNEGSCSFTITVSDNESPNVTCPMNVSAVVDSGSSVATILWELTPSAVDNIDTIDPASIICVDNSGSIVTSGGQYPAILTTVTCQVNDTQQNEGSCSFTIAVSDNESPNVTCPMNVSAVVDSGSSVATILWELTPSAVDNIDTIDPASIICVDNSGSIVMSGGQYPATLTTVTCQVNDTQQNEGSCSFTIAVSAQWWILDQQLPLSFGYQPHRPLITLIPSTLQVSFVWTTLGVS